ncbi:CoA-binding domain-containing protein [Mycena venus]|uniref:CoA-binding domain-containing protein n=1 Tax=Mycena venus TaxID=2733690 RepID=A0A8H6YSW9_9AGAR|nr:CoA-binding domain-containing protein [Mycena venus]
MLGVYKLLRQCLPLWGRTSSDLVFSPWTLYLSFKSGLLSNFNMHSRFYLYALLSMALQTCAGSQSKASLHETMLEKGIDVVPINPFVSESQGIPCLHSLAEIADLAQTSISVVTQPAILQQATALGILAVWLQPGAEDDAVLECIRNADANSMIQTKFIHSAVPLTDVVRCDNDTGGPYPRDGPETPDLISTLSRQN